MGLMIGIDTLAIGLLKFFVSLLRGKTVESELYTTGIIVMGTIDTFDGRITGVDISPSVLLFFIDSHHFEGKVTQFHKLPDEGCLPTCPLLCRITCNTQKFLCLLITHHKHLTTLLHVDFVNVTPIEHLHLVNLRMVRIDTTDGTGDILLTIADST